MVNILGQREVNEMFYRPGQLEPICNFICLSDLWDKLNSLKNRRGCILISLVLSCLVNDVIVPLQYAICLNAAKLPFSAYWNFTFMVLVYYHHQQSSILCIRLSW